MIKKIRITKITLQYFQSIDGIYNSFWIGKFLNLFISKGKKKKIYKQIYKALLLIKFNTKILPFLFLLELLESIKPTFKLENCFPGKTKVIYPKIVNSFKQYKICLYWLKLDINNTVDTNQIAVPFSINLYQKLVGLKNSKKHIIFKKRDQYHQDAVKLQENMRYTWNRR